MYTIFTNSRNSKTSGPHWLSLNLLNKINIKGSGKYVALSNLSIYYTSKNIRNSCKTNKFKIWTPTWKEECYLTDRSYSISDIQECFENILEEHGEKRLIFLH